MSLNWQKIEEVFHQASGLAPQQRSAFLEVACAEDEEVRGEVEGLLATDDSGKQLPGAFVNPALAPGQSLDHFEILAACGQGTGGAVYRARDQRTGHVVALKVFPPFLTPELRRRNLKETRAVSVLHHPHVVALEEAGRSADRD